MYSMALLAIFFAGDMLGATMASRPGTQVSNTVLEFLPGTAWEPFHTCTGQDSMPIAWFNRRTNTSYFMSAQHERMVAGIAPSLDVTPTACSGRIFEGHDAHGYDSGPQSYANFQWLQSIRVFANGTAVGLVHNEFKGEFAPLGTYCSKQCRDRSPVNASGCRDVICELWSTGLAVSADGGTTFELVASPPNHLVAALPHKFNWDEPISGYGAISPMLRGADGAFYGSINVINRCTHGNPACGNIPGGNCVWRASDLRDSSSFRARDRTGAFTVRWASAYAPGGEGKGDCATIPVTEDGPFGSHVTFRKIVPPTDPRQQVSGSRQPTFIALGDASTGRVKYSLSYATDFGAAMRDINTSWTKPQYLDLDGMHYVYPTLLDVRSPTLGQLSGTVEGREDGDSFALASYPTVGPPRPGPVVSVQVSGAGSNACNGVYAKATVPPGFGSVSHLFQLDANHSIYRNEDEWHLAHLGVTVWYSSKDVSPPGGGPPSTGWVVVAGHTPAPASVVSVRGPNITAASSLYLYLRGKGIMRRQVQLRNVDGQDPS